MQHGLTADRRLALTGWLAALFPLALLVFFLGQAAAGGGDSRVFVLGPGAVEELGLRLAFRLDGLSLLFAVLITGVGTLIFGFSGHYFAGRRRLGLFLFYLTLFMLSMLGVVLAENLIALFIFWELTSITSWLLIGFNHERQSARDSALQALLVTGGGGMVLLAGLVLLGSIAGTFELSAIAEQAEMLRVHPLYGWVLGLVLLGALTKSAQVPFHFWLPSAMEAPSPVSAYLHSATMVKAGVYLLARLLTTLGGTESWTTTLTAVGSLTMIVGAVMAVFVSDLKRILAYTTISAMGTLVMLLGIGTPAAAGAAIVFLVAHALYKAALFLTAGIVDHETGTRDVTRLGALHRTMPLTATGAVLAGISLLAFGPVLSFAAKDLLMKAVAGSEWSLPLKFAVYAAAAMVTMAAALVVIKPFFGTVRSAVQVHDPPAGMWVPPLLLASAGVIVGVLPTSVTAFLLAPAAAAVHPEAGGVRVALWHGLSLSLLFTALAVAAGSLLYRTKDSWLPVFAPASRIAGIGPAAWYRLTIAGSLRLAEWQSRVLQSGYLPTYLLVVIVTLTALVSLALFATGLPQLRWSLTDVRLHELVVVSLIIAGAFTAARAESRLGAVASLGVVGYSVALVFIFFGAPDLAMTQFLIETLTVILFVLVLYRLPRFTRLTRPATRVRDIAVSCAAGAVMTLLVLAATGLPSSSALSRYYASNSVDQAHGRNIVNVILVDFRALDTLGEITVVAVAASGVFALLRLRPWKEGA